MGQENDIPDWAEGEAEEEKPQGKFDLETPDWADEEVPDESPSGLQQAGEAVVDTAKSIGGGIAAPLETLEDLSIGASHGNVFRQPMQKFFSGIEAGAGKLNEMIHDVPERARVSFKDRLMEKFREKEALANKEYEEAGARSPVATSIGGAVGSLGSSGAVPFSGAKGLGGAGKRIGAAAATSFGLEGFGSQEKPFDFQRASDAADLSGLIQGGFEAAPPVIRAGARAAKPYVAPIAEKAVEKVGKPLVSGAVETMARMSKTPREYLERYWNRPKEVMAAPEVPAISQSIQDTIGQLKTKVSDSSRAALETIPEDLQIPSNELVSKVRSARDRIAESMTTNEDEKAVKELTKVMERLGGKDLAPVEFPEVSKILEKPVKPKVVGEVGKLGKSEKEITVEVRENQYDSFDDQGDGGDLLGSDIVTTYSGTPEEVYQQIQREHGGGFSPSASEFHKDMNYYSEMEGLSDGSSVDFHLDIKGDKLGQRELHEYMTGKRKPSDFTTAREKVGQGPKKLWNQPTHPEHDTFTPQDHKEAAQYYDDLTEKMDEKYAGGVMGGMESDEYYKGPGPLKQKLRKQYLDYVEKAKQHEILARIKHNKDWQSANPVLSEGGGGIGQTTSGKPIPLSGEVEGLGYTPKDFKDAIAFHKQRYEEADKHLPMFNISPFQRNSASFERTEAGQRMAELRQQGHTSRKAAEKLEQQSLKLSVSAEDFPMIEHLRTYPESADTLKKMYPNKEGVIDEFMAKYREENPERVMPPLLSKDDLQKIEGGGEGSFITGRNLKKRIQSIDKRLEKGKANKLWMEPIHQEYSGLRRDMDELLKGNEARGQAPLAPGYKEAMKPVAESTAALSGAKGKFKNVDQGVTRLNAIANQPGKNSEGIKALKALDKEMGTNFYEQNLDRRTREHFDKNISGGAGHRLAITGGVGAMGILSSEMGLSPTEKAFLAGAVGAGGFALDLFLPKLNKVAIDAARAVYNRRGMLGKYGPILEKAAAKGPTSLGLTHLILSENNPEYSDLVSSSEIREAQLEALRQK